LYFDALEKMRHDWTRGYVVSILPSTERFLKRNHMPSQSNSDFLIMERAFSDDDRHLSIGLANIHAFVPGIEAKVFEDLLNLL